MLSHRLRYLWYLTAGASALRGLRLSREWWERDYARGGLARIDTEVELPRHLLVASLIRHYAPGPRVLDIGCGTGALAAPLHESLGPALGYVGIDLSATAVRMAEERRDASDGLLRESVEFTAADFDEFVPSGPLDAVVFSESLYYAADTRATVQRYTASLNEGGIIIVSMWRRPSRLRLWWRLGRHLHERSRSRLVVPMRPSWDIVVYDVR
jgi:2-polyprenyl-3-methyl-5-hydroxy-6-metoxy-1,4-benzoquinol methylase